MRRLISSALDYTGPTLGGVALWLFTVTGWPLFIRAFRTSEDYEPEIASSGKDS